MNPNHSSTHKNDDVATDIMSTAEFFKVLSDPTRLSLLKLIQQNDALCVCDLVEALDIPQPTVSRHLGRLKTGGLVRVERRGTWMWYSLNNDLPNWCLKIMETTFNHIPMTEPQMQAVAHCQSCS